MPRPEDEYPEEPRPARRRRDDDDDYGDEPRGRKLTGMDGLFVNTNFVLLILFAVCCNGIALILGIVGLVTCTDPRAKQNALTVTIIGGIITGIGIVLQVVMALSRQ